MFSVVSVPSNFKRFQNKQLKPLFKVIRNIKEMASYTPATVGESEQWSSIVSTGEENR
jgi:hypothetical protein